MGSLFVCVYTVCVVYGLVLFIGYADVFVGDLLFLLSCFFFFLVFSFAENFEEEKTIKKTFIKH